MSGSTGSPPTHTVCASLLPHAGLSLSSPCCSPSRSPRPSPPPHRRGPRPPAAHAAATCADYPNQAAAQRAADTRDPDGDGVYCESLPCPCAGPGARPSPPAPATPAPSQRSCQHPVRDPEHHVLQDQVPPHPPPLPAPPAATAGRAPWSSTAPARTSAANACSRTSRPAPASTATSTRRRSAAARARASSAAATRAAGRPTSPTSPAHENRSHGSSLGLKLRRFCDGTRFRYVFY